MVYQWRSSVISQVFCIIYQVAVAAARMRCACEARVGRYMSCFMRLICGCVSACLIPQCQIFEHLHTSVHMLVMLIRMMMTDAG
jgi:hypothetical protein